MEDFLEPTQGRIPDPGQAPNDTAHTTPRPGSGGRHIRGGVQRRQSRLDSTSPCGKRVRREHGKTPAPPVSNGYNVGWVRVGHPRGDSMAYQRQQHRQYQQALRGFRSFKHLVELDQAAIAQKAVEEAEDSRLATKFLRLTPQQEAVLHDLQIGLTQGVVWES